MINKNLQSKLLNCKFTNLDYNTTKSAFFDEMYFPLGVLNRQDSSDLCENDDDQEYEYDPEDDYDVANYAGEEGDDDDEDVDAN